MFKKIFTLFCIYIAFSLSALSFSDYNISELEYLKYGETFPYESIGERLNRLETDYFGMSQTGDIEQRLANLSKINSKSENFSAYNNYYNQKPKGIFKSFWEDVTSGFNNNGYVTGYTPSMLNTMTTSGYSDIQPGLSRINPSSNFCPYSHYRNNSQKRYSQFDSRKYNGVNRFTKHRQNKNIFRHNENNIPYTNTTYYSLPPNIQTQSSVHILKD